VQQTSSQLEPRDYSAPLLSEILAALSFALDLTEGAVPGHAIRSCLLALRIGGALGLKNAELSELYYASLLKDVGCSSNAARMCEIVGGDDRAVKAGAKLEDWTRPYRPQLSTLKLLWKQVLPGQSSWRKARRILKIGATQHANNRELIELRCDRGASIVRKIGLGIPIAEGIRHLDEHWDGGGYPGNLTGRHIPLLSRIMGVSQHLDAFSMEVGGERAIDVMVERTGRWFDPEVTRATLGLYRSGRLWQHCLPMDGHGNAHRAVLDSEFADNQRLAPGSVDGICEAFAEVVDIKSPFTFRHSVGVKDAAMSIGRSLGLPESRLQVLRRAALLHDIGKLSVSNLILDKPAKLDDAEFSIVKQHSALSRQILSKVPAFEEIAVLAGEHHEKLDGTGYPFGLTAGDLSLMSRLIAVADVYGALAEDRPYRPGMNIDEISRILKTQSHGKLDAQCVEVVLETRLDLQNDARIDTRPDHLSDLSMPLPMPPSPAAGNSSASL
jgi:putative nucleotidyltransferase with HDIG domain